MPQRPLAVSFRRRFCCHLEKNPCSEKEDFEGSLENGSFPYDAGSRAVHWRSRLRERPSLVSRALCDASHGLFFSYKFYRFKNT